MRKIQILVLGLLTVVISTCSSGSGRVDGGVRETSRYSVVYEGPELQATVRHYQAERDLGGEWLILVAHLRGAHSGGITKIHRRDISLRTPDGRRLPLITRAEFRKVYAEIHSGVRRATATSAPLWTYGGDPRPCDRWFLAEPMGGFAQDEIAISNFEVCWGPLVFQVTGGVQPGRWRLVIELVESTADIPFELEVGE
jgi:hypothetical protein